jgi:NADH-quinone oxidoreductase subunit H
LPFLLAYTVFAVYAERKVSAFIQNRLGPMEAGPYGIFQTVADLLKLLQKEHIRPFASLPLMFMMAPVVIFIAVFTGFAVLPLGQDFPGSSMDSGLFFLIAILGLEITGILMAGYASGNKYSTLGAVRAVAQLLTYEIPLGLIVLMVIIWTGTADLSEIGAGQQSGIFNWYIFSMPLFIPAWIIFFICSLAESNRAPFDLPEAESELVAGFHTEYSGFPWAVIMLAEYAMMLLTALLGSILFFGAWHTPFFNVGSFALADWTTGPVWGVFWLFSKALIFVLIQIWVRWTFPRVRINQMLAMGWKYLTPFGLALLLLTGFIKIYLIR